MDPFVGGVLVAFTVFLEKAVNGAHRICFRFTYEFKPFERPKTIP